MSRRKYGNDKFFTRISHGAVTGVIGDDQYEVKGESNLRAVSTFASSGTLTIQGRIEGSSTWDNLGTLTSGGDSDTFDVSTYDFVRFNFTVAAGSSGEIAASGFFSGGSGSGAGATNTFSIIQPDLGTSPTADSATDTLTITSSDSSITVTGNATTDTIDLVVATAPVSALDDLSDVTVIAPANGQILSYNSVSSLWENTSPAGGGDVTGPVSSTDNAIARFDGVTGKVIQGYTSNAPTITDDGVASFPDTTYTLTERIGLGATVTATRGHAYGNIATAAQNGTAVGYFARSSGISSAALGHASTASNFGSTAVGSAANITGNQGVGLGPSTQASGTFGFALGASAKGNATYAIAIGSNCNATHERSILIGRGAASTTTGQVILGGDFHCYNDFYLGARPQGNRRVDIGRDTKVFFPIIAGTTDESAYDVHFYSQTGTGTGSGGDFTFNTAPAGASGSTTNTYVEQLRITDDGNIIMPNLPTASAGLPTGALWNDAGTIKIA